MMNKYFAGIETIALATAQKLTLVIGLISKEFRSKFDLGIGSGVLVIRCGDDN
jgi:hypothetical protein